MFYCIYRLGYCKIIINIQIFLPIMKVNLFHAYIKNMGSTQIYLNYVNIAMNSINYIMSSESFALFSPEH
jgi:hypothetical protein